MLETYRETSRSSTVRTSAASGSPRPGQDRHHGEDRSTKTRPGASVGPRDVPPDRAARIAEIKRQIADGTYETDRKLDRAVNGLLGDLDG